jgi:hypothetical protein
MVCPFHGGTFGRPCSPMRALVRSIQIAERAGLVPLELTRMRPWQDARRNARRCAAALVALLAAWCAGDGVGWARAVGTVPARW